MLPSPNQEYISSNTGLTVLHQGPPLEVGPLPSFFYFALSANDSMNLDPYNQPIQFLESDNIRVFTVTIPGHGPVLDNNKAMEFWANEIRSNRNFINSFIENCSQDISDLIDQGYIEENHLAVAGLSRGGFIATHLAAKDPRISTVLAYAPLVDIADLDEFQDLRNHPLTTALRLENLIPRLTQKRMRIYAGNRDTRVNTDSVYRFVRLLAEAAFQEGLRSPTIELMLSPSIGYRGHGTPPHVFRNGIEWLKERI